MVFSLIDKKVTNYGQIWQSGVIASEDWDDHGLIVSMSGNENWQPPCLWIDIPDNDDYALPDSMLIAFVNAIHAFLVQGKDVLIHCNEGKYRSTYMDVAAHMREGMTFETAYALVKEKHPIACLRAGTMAQLKRMESILNGGIK